jgi:hypothetical protein
MKKNAAYQGGIYLKKIVRYDGALWQPPFLCGRFAAALILQPPNWKPYTVVALSAGLIATFLFFTMNQRLQPHG